MAEKQKSKNDFWAFARENMIVLAFFLIMLVVASGIIINWFRPASEDKVVFNITGVTDSINATTLTQLHFECMKYCANKFYDSGGKLTECYSQCATLGKEQVCGGEK